MDLQINIHADDTALEFARLIRDAAKMTRGEATVKAPEGPIPDEVTVRSPGKESFTIPGPDAQSAEAQQVVDTAPEPVIEPIESDPLPEWTTNTAHDEPAVEETKAPAKELTVADVRAAAKEFLDKQGAEGGKALKHLLHKFGAAKVGALKPEDCAPFMDALLEEMGVANDA